MRFCVAWRAEEYGYEKFESGSIDTVSVWPVEGFDDVSPVDGGILQEGYSVGKSERAIFCYQPLTKRLRARTKDDTSHMVVPSAASRLRVDIISTTCASRGGLISDIPKRTSKARTASVSLVISGPSWIRTCTREVPGARLKRTCQTIDAYGRIKWLTSG